jgi:hypothetical protein
MNITTRLFAAVLTAMSGAAVMVAISAPGSIQTGFVVMASSGAFVAGAVAGPLFGHPSREGLVLAGIGAVFSTLLGAALGGLAFAIVSGEILMVLAAPFLVGQFMLTSLPVLGTWVVTMCGVHGVMLLLRQDEALET